MDLDSHAFPPAATPTAATPEPTPQPSLAGARAAHPLIWAAMLVWLSVEAIGDGLRALGSVLNDLASSNTTSSSPIASPAASERVTTGTAISDQSSETPTPTPSW